MADIFISYSKTQRAATERLAAELQAKGFSVWWDTELVSGQSFADTILAELDAARAAIVIWTKDSAKSQWVRSEATRASRRGILIPTRDEAFDPNDIPPPFDNLHTDVVTNRTAILMALSKLGVTAPPPPSPPPAPEPSPTLTEAVSQSRVEQRAEPAVVATSPSATVRQVQSPESMTPAFGWRIPLVLILFGCSISVLTFGPRSALGLFLTPLSQSNAWGRDVFALALAIQNLLWGLGLPFTGAIADKYGAPRVLSAGAILYALGLYITSIAATPGELYLSAGVLIGFGLSGCAVPTVIGALGKLLPDGWGPLAFGAVTAAGSFGQFLFSPLAVHFIDVYGWQSTLLIFSALLLLVIPISMTLMAPRKAEAVSSAAPPSQPLKQALAEAFGHRSYVLLVLGFFTCGFQLAFVTAHLPAYLIDRGLSAEVGGWTLAVIGLFNIVGSLGSGWLATFMPKRYILSFIYFARALSIVAFIMLPASTTVTLTFAAVTGLLWLSTVPPTSGLVALMFGTRWLTMLFGFAFFSHQVGGFLGVWLGGIVFERTGSYDAIWWLSVLFGVLSALINLPIVEKPVQRLAPAAA